MRSTWLKLRIQKETEPTLHMWMKQGGRNGHNSRGGSPRCHSASPPSESRSDGAPAGDGAGALALWGPQACCSPQAGSLQLLPARPGWSASVWLGLLWLCALEPSSALFPVQGQPTPLVLESLTAGRAELLPRRAPRSQWRVRGDGPRAALHNSRS